MPPKAQGYAIAKLAAAGQRAAECVQKQYSDVILTCAYIGVPDGQGGYDLSVRARARETHVAFEWKATASNIGVERQVVTIRCDHAFKHGAPFPAGWRVALRSLSLDAIAEASASQFAARHRVTDVECVVLGAVSYTHLTLPTT